MYLLLGYGISNKSISKFFDLEKINYLIYDDYIEEYKNIEIDFSKVNCVIKSGSISNNHFILTKAKNNGIRIISDLELFFEYKKCLKIIAITGTNGKSTTVCLLKHLINDINLGGNIGIPLFDFIDSKKDIIIEVSSYMGEYLNNFKPDIGCILNINKSHILHHGSFKNYINSKLNVFKNMDYEDIFYYNEKDFKYIKSLKTNKICYSDFKIKIKNKYLKNFPDNVLASCLIALKYGINLKVIKERLKSFKGLTHRIEEFLVYKKKVFVNDSKSTNIYALNNAINFYKKKKILLICGGKEKDDDLSLIKTNRKIVVIVNGENRKQLFDEFYKRKIPCFIYDNLEEVINNIHKHIKNIDIILFSFGSESFDQFNNFEERGNYLKDKIIQKFQKNNLYN